MIRRRPRFHVVPPIVSMGDIAFLLIIFFITTSIFVKEKHIDLDPAASPDIQPLKERQVSVAMDRDGRLWVQGAACPVEVLEEAIAALLSEREDHTVMLKIHREIRHEHYRPVFLALSRANAEIALVGEKETR